MGHPHQSGRSHGVVARTQNASRISELKIEDRPALLMFAWRCAGAARVCLHIVPFQNLEQHIKEVWQYSKE